MLKEKITTESKKRKISLRDDKILHAIIKYSKNNCTKPPISALFCIGSLLLTFHVCFLCMWKGREGSEKISTPNINYYKQQQKEPLRLEGSLCTIYKQDLF